jgi:hypothetical protein
VKSKLNPFEGIDMSVIHRLCSFGTEWFSNPWLVSKHLNIFVWEQSYDFGIYNYNPSVVVGQGVFTVSKIF